MFSKCRGDAFQEVAKILAHEAVGLECQRDELSGNVAARHDLGPLRRLRSGTHGRAVALPCGHRRGRIACTEGVDTGNITIHKSTITQASLHVNTVLAISDNHLRLGREARFRTQVTCCACDTVVSPPEATELLAAENVMDALVGFAARAPGAWGQVRMAMQEVGDDSVLLVRDV